jgi:hypothetical protein
MTILVPGASAQVRAIKNYGLYGGQVDVTAFATWSTSDASVVMVSAGLATAIAPGSADVTAAVDGLTAAIGIRVAPSKVLLTGQIDAETAADIIAYNQEAGPLGNSHKGTITRFDLPVRVYVDSSFARFADCPQHAVKSWASPTGLPIVFIDNNIEPRIQMVVQFLADYRGYMVVDSVNLDNSLRAVTIKMPTWGPPCDAPVEDAVTHELGHALGILGHPDWGGVMAVRSSAARCRRSERHWAVDDARHGRHGDRQHLLRSHQVRTAEGSERISGHDDGRSIVDRYSRVGVTGPTRRNVRDHERSAAAGAH